MIVWRKKSCTSTVQFVSYCRKTGVVQELWGWWWMARWKEIGPVLSYGSAAGVTYCCVFCAAWCASSLLGRTARLSLCVSRTHAHHQDTVCRCPQSYQGACLGLLWVSDKTHNRKLYRVSQEDRRLLATVGQKRFHCTLASNFAKCWPIFKCLGPTDSSVKL